jgi:hypothetical protein
VLGGAAPDAFKKFLGGGEALHSFEFAGYQLLFALQYVAAGAGDFDAVAYSRGFGAHIAADAVGHHHDGYITHQHDHALEAAVDTWYVTTFPHHDYTYQPFRAFAPALLNFVSQAIATYARAVPNSRVSAFPLESLQSALQNFDTLTSAEWTLVKFNTFSKPSMVQFDNYGAPDFASARAHLELAEQCALQAARHWQTLMEQPHADATEVGKATHAFIDTLFAEKKCQP